MKKICIIGGCGHIGIPLGLVLASKNYDVLLLDKNKDYVDKINSGILPFMEEDACDILKTYLNKNIFATTDKNKIQNQDIIVFATSTPIDENQNPEINNITEVIKEYLPLLNKNQLIILRSTLSPGTTEAIDEILKKEWGNTKVAFCPERILQGKGIIETRNLPQIISATSEEALKEVEEIFNKISLKTIKLEPQEAEIAKLMTNAWRYLEFAIANQFYMMVEDKGFDFYKIFNAIKNDYPRAQTFAQAGLTAGPCLLKDTIQLSAFYKNQFSLGQSAILVNEGLPVFLVSQLENKIGSLKNKKIAILGLTFKADNDDTRKSLSFKIKKELECKMAEVLLSDPYIEGTMDYKEAIEKADGIILGTPHHFFSDLKITKPYVDCWNIWK